MLVKSNEVLGHAVEKQTTNQSVKMWLCKLQNLACGVEYLLDEFQMESFQRKLMLDDDAVDESDSIAMSKIKEVNARLQDIASQIDPLGLKESSDGKFRNVRLRLPAVPLLFLAAVRRVGRDPGPAIFSPLIKKAKDLAFLEKKGGLASLEKIGSGGCGEVYKAELPGQNGRMISIKKIVGPPMDAAALIEEDSMLLNKKMRQIQSEMLLNKKMRQIQSEINTVGQIRHRNLHPLLAHVTRPDCHLLCVRIHEELKFTRHSQQCLTRETRIRLAS
ncbi:leucine-rich repeat receptor-like serine/threonine/tyrosine-protein kinase SOBIR1 [Citrus sinensis]|nr:leucine-rich repeat receptor-like serine/threonine/tyrosine-protein kinase SOBIR1 [Citrus sinensis]